MNSKDCQLLIKGIQLLIRQLDENINEKRSKDYIENEEQIDELCEVRCSAEELKRKILKEWKLILNK